VVRRRTVGLSSVLSGGTSQSRMFSGTSQFCVVGWDFSVPYVQWDFSVPFVRWDFSVPLNMESFEGAQHETGLVTEVVQTGDQAQIR
jgi:hypothetical protein